VDGGTLLALLGIGVAAVALAVIAATETALERASDVRIQALAAQKHPKALRIASNVREPRAFLAPLTLARVLCAGTVVALAAYAGAKSYGPLGGALGIGIAAAGGVAVIELSVGLVAARAPEYAALQLGGVVRAVGMIFGVPALLLGLPARLLARSLRVVKVNADIDVLSLVEREEAQGGVAELERRMIRGVIALEDKTAREIMIPRIDIAAADVEETVEDIARLVTERGYSRVPIYRENVDDVVGIIYAKDLLRAVSNGGRARSLTDLAREAYFIPESKRLDELLTEMKAKRTHMAIVVDEYGGTAGLVTIEDLLEEIVGEIEDEYDIAGPQTEVLSENEALVDGGVTTDVLKELFGYTVESEDFDTVGGFLMHELGRLPTVGDEVRVDGLTLRVLSMSGRRVRRLRITRAHPEDEARDEAELSRSA
jgi:CBS domain containing-hemolysin-like protein